MVLSSLADEVTCDSGRILSAQPEKLLLPFLKSINQLPIDIKQVNIASEGIVYTEIVLTQTLKEGLQALFNQNEEKTYYINASLNTDSYKAFCDEKTPIPDFYKALLISSNIMSWRNNEDSATLELSPRNKANRDLFERGLSFNKPGWTLTQLNASNYELAISDPDAKYPDEVTMGDILFTNFPHEVLRYSLSFKEALFDMCELRFTEEGLIEKLEPNDPIDVTLVTHDNFFDEIGDEMFNHELADILGDILKKEEFSGFIIKFNGDYTRDYRGIYAQGYEEECDYFVIRFTHPFYPAEECHVAFGETVYYPDRPITVFKRPTREIVDNSDLIIFEDDDYDKAELSLLEALHLILSVTRLPKVKFLSPWR